MESQPDPRVHRSVADWETLVGGNWLNKLGVLILVIGIALALGYSFTRIGPSGRVAASLAVSSAMLLSGVAYEGRERYRTFARGLLGGGWAALYFTVYAMHALPAARLVSDPLLAALLLIAVSAGMILHSLRYRSETVTGLAYFIAFATLAITEVTSLAVVALIPLAASLLYVAHRFHWRRFSYLGLLATYAVLILRGDHGAPLWQAQALFGVYWLIFEAFDILAADTLLLPFNVTGVILSALKWHHVAPHAMWQVPAAAAVLYTVSAILRARRGLWQPAIALAAALAASAIFLHLDSQWIAAALLAQAEVLYLAGVLLRAPFLRYLALCVFGVGIDRLLIADVPGHHWEPVAMAGAAVFYLNRLVTPEETWYGYAGTGMLMLLLGFHAPHHDRGLAWMLLGAVPFVIGWRRRLMDFRIQGYAFGVLGFAAMGGAMLEPRLSLAIGAVLMYALALCGRFAAADGFHEFEPDLMRLSGSAAAAMLLMAALWQSVAHPYRGLAWIALAAVLLELGMRNLPAELRRISYGATFAGAAMSASAPGWIPLATGAIAYWIAFRARKEERGAVLHATSAIGTLFMLPAAWNLLPEQMVAPAWGAMAVALLAAARLRWQSYGMAALAFVAAGLNTDSRMAILTASSLYAAQLLEPRDSRARIYYSLLASTLMGTLLYREVSGSMLTVAWGAQGIALLAAGFPLRDRVLRLSGMGLLGVCILKLFLYDLRFLDTLPRIFSFIVLGLILVAVSWIYTRFRERVERFL
jgi:hypothetical protein